MKPGSIVVRYRTVSLTVFQWSPRPDVVYWKFHHGRKSVVRSTLEKAKAEAKRIAEETYLGRASLGSLTDSQTRAIRRMLAADPSLASVDEFLVWRGKQVPRHACKGAVSEYLAIKKANAGSSPHNVRVLSRHLALLPDMVLADITAGDLPALTGTPRTRKNHLSSWKGFFKWCASRGYLPEGKTVLDSIELPRITRTTPSTWSPEELDILLAGVSPEYAHWLALAAFAGIRTEEICPDLKSTKSPLQWSDFHWDRMLIEIRPETSKTGHRRIIPILPRLAALLPRDRVGRVGPLLPPHRPGHSSREHKDPQPKKHGKGYTKGRKAYAGIPAETTRLGKLVGGWKRNALRHSFISYRAAMPGVGIAQAASEAGNSESVSRRAYQDAKGADESARWFQSCEVESDAIAARSPS